MKKRIACVCVAAMLLALLGGCTGDSPAVSAPEENSAVSSSSTTTTTTTTAEDATTTTTASATVTGDPTTNTTNKPTATAPVKPTTGTKAPTTTTATTTTVKPTTTISTPPTKKTVWIVPEEYAHNGRLIVEGVDITEDTYFQFVPVSTPGVGGYFDYCPLFAIVQALGGSSVWLDETTALITLDNHRYVLDTTIKNMGWYGDTTAYHVFFDMSEVTAIIGDALDEECLIGETSLRCFLSTLDIGIDIDRGTGTMIIGRNVDGLPPCGCKEAHLNRSRYLVEQENK